MNNKLTSENFEYNKDILNDAVLGVLEGPCADIINPTRNNRSYPETLWEKVFLDPIVNELLENGGIFGELDHPLDGREETDSARIAIAMKEKPVKKNGKLWAKFYILNTPLGKILKTMCDFGYKIGISSRGSGDLVTDDYGNESVDPDTYEFRTFDAVIVPAVKEARLQYVTESLNSNKKVSLTESLNKLVESATEDEKLVMTETLNNLGISLTEDTTAAGVNYEALRTEAKTLLKDTYGNITNNKDLEAALKKAVDEQNKENIMTVAKLLKKYDPDFVKDHSKVNDLAERPIKDTSIDDLSLEMPETTVENTESTPSIEDETPVDESLDNNEKKVVYNNDKDNSASWTSDELTEAIKTIQNLGYANFELFTEAVKSLDSQQRQINAADDNIDEDINDTNDSNNLMDMINALQEALLSKLTIEAETLKLNEKLSVCYAKEAKQEVEISLLKEALKKSDKTNSIVENLKERSSNLTNLLNEANGQIRNLNSKCQDIVNQYNTLAENYNNKQVELVKLNESIKANTKMIQELQNSNKALLENLIKQKEESQQLLESYSTKLNESNKLVEKYKAVANKAVSKYIDSLALKLDITSNEIKNRLPASYNFNDIDLICESLSAAKVSMNLLPFRNPSKLRENMKLEIKGLKEPILESNLYSVDDEVDDTLKTLAGM